MRIDKNKGISEELKNKIVEKVNGAEDKGAAITEAIEMAVAEMNSGLIDQIVKESERAQHDADFRQTLGLRSVFSENEKKFYEMLKGGAKQALTANQIDVIPTETVDRVLADVRTEYPITELINFAPANVKHWLTGAKSGAAVWGTLTAALTSSGELSATISGLNIEVAKLYAYCVIPKAIRDLEIGYVDKYFRAILNEAIYDGIAAGYIDGDGKVAPIGILRQIGNTAQDGTHTAKTVAATLTGFSPKQMAPVIKALSNGGKRPVGELYLIVNPADAADYVYPAMYGDSLTAGYVNKTFRPITVIEEPQMAAGKAAITMKGYYTMGFSGMKVDEYKETKALDDADLLIAKVYGNGRADDDNVAYVFNPTRLVEYVPTVKQAAEE